MTRTCAHGRRGTGRGLRRGACGAADERQADRDLGPGAPAGARRGTVPPCSSTRPFTSVRPRPRPPRERARLRSACENGSKMRGRTSGSIPSPVSRTSRSAAPPGSSPTRTVTVPPRGVNFAELASRFPDDLRDPGLVALDRDGRGRQLQERARRRRPRTRRGGPRPCRERARRDPAAARWSWIRPRVMRVRSSRSSTSRERCPICRSITSRARAARAGVVRRAGEEVERVPDRRERVAELVRQDPEELVLAPIRLGELLGDGAVTVLALLPRALAAFSEVRSMTNAARPSC